MLIEEIIAVIRARNCGVSACGIAKYGGQELTSEVQQAISHECEAAVARGEMIAYRIEGLPAFYDVLSIAHRSGEPSATELIAHNAGRSMVRSHDLSDDDYFVFYGNHDRGDSRGFFVRRGRENAERSASLLSQCGYRFVEVRDVLSVGQFPSGG